MKRSSLGAFPIRQAPVEPPVALDRIDRKILNALQEDNQITNLELAARVGISPPPCLRRVRRLRESGVIFRDVSLVDRAKVGRNLMVFASITLERQREDLLESFERKMLAQPEVMQCYFVSGDADYLLVVNVPDMDAYDAFARRVFANEPNIRMFRSSFALSVVKYDTKIALDEAPDASRQQEREDSRPPRPKGDRRSSRRSA